MTEPTIHVLIAIIVWAAIAAVRRWAPEVFEMLPRRFQSYPAAIVGALMSALSGVFADGVPSTVGLGALLLQVGSDAVLGAFDGLTAVGGHHALKLYRKSPSIIPKPTRITILFALCGALATVGCGGVGSPVLSALDAVGAKAATLLGWCADHGADAATIKRAAEALAAEDYVTAIEETARMVEALRAAGKPIPVEVETGLRLAQGTLAGLKAAQALEDASRALATSP